MEACCQCGLVKFTTPVPAPMKIYICHCTECRHQSSSAFGISAIFPMFDIPSPAAENLGIYSRVTLRNRRVDCYFCKNCGSRLVHRADGEKTLSVKGGCLVGLTKEMVMGEGVPGGVSHIWCKRAVVEIPEGVERWEEEPADKPASVIEE
jgi:hypothetical protein